ncbi:hypothetical protein ABGY98_002816 [Salmonella enterica]|nr:hypothetical protein [Salmonella enterica]ECJ5893000.1 hypothetical protein [Salmonella enterica subsp. diarizonae]ECS3896944.1 hypothetical protein [Salmonella enterica subsp. diarizonae serovar 48:i:z]EAM6403905.1 hypothetical protein [Salmonella enterica]EAN2414927.1 hypothetical protein [Salmonella enterica]
MKSGAEWFLFAKWAVIWLLILPWIVWRFSDVKLFHSHFVFLVVAGFAMGLAVRLIDRLFYFLLQHDSGKRR